MSTTIILKILGASAAGAGAVAGITYVSYNQLNTNKETSVSQTPSVTQPIIADSKEKFYVISEGTSEPANSENVSNEVINLNPKNYSCSVSSSTNTTDVDCIINNFYTTTISKNYVQFSELTSEDKLSKTSLTKEELKTINSLFRIEVSSSFYSSFTSGNAFADKIKVVSTKDSKIYGILKPLFGIKGKDVIANTGYSVGKVSKITDEQSSKADESSVTINTEKSKCKFISGDNTGVSCKISSYSSSSSGDEENFSSLTFGQSFTEQSSINKNKYYLFNFEDSVAKSVSEFVSAKGSIILTPSVTVQVSGENNKAIDKLEVSDLIPVIITGSSNSSIAVLFRDIPEAASV